MQLLKHVANAMQRAEGYVLERALVFVVVWLITKLQGAIFQPHSSEECGLPITCRMVFALQQSS